MPLDFQRTIGGGDRIRTRDPQLAKLVLYQLSYAPNVRKAQCGRPDDSDNTSSFEVHPMVHPSGFEPLTSRLSGACSNQLSYGCVVQLTRQK